MGARVTPNAWRTAKALALLAQSLLLGSWACRRTHRWRHRVVSLHLDRLTRSPCGSHGSPHPDCLLVERVLRPGGQIDRATVHIDITRLGSGNDTPTDRLRPL